MLVNDSLVTAALYSQ